MPTILPNAKCDPLQKREKTEKHTIVFATGDNGKSAPRRYPYPKKRRRKIRRVCVQQAGDLLRLTGKAHIVCAVQREYAPYPLVLFAETIDCKESCVQRVKGCNKISTVCKYNTPPEKIFRQGAVLVAHYKTGLSFAYLRLDHRCCMGNNGKRILHYNSFRPIK